MECQECYDYGFYAAILLMASLHALLLASILFFSKKLNSTANKYLALCLLGIFIILFYEFADFEGLIESYPAWFDFLPTYLRTPIPVGIFYFTLFLIQPDHQLSRWEKSGFAFLGFEVFLQCLHIFPDILWEDKARLNSFHESLNLVEEFFGVGVCFILLPLAIQKINRYQKFLYGHYSTTRAKSLSWLRNFIYLSLLLVSIWLITIFQSILGFEKAYYATYAIMNLGIVMIMFWIGYFIILHYQWFQIVALPENIDKPKSVGSKLSTKTDTYHTDLLDLMKKEKLYEKVDLTLENLAQSLQISSGYLSQIINEKEQKNFFEFVNLYRVESVKEKLLNPDFDNYTIMGIALESGFKSKSTFNSVFKKFTGQTPSAFKRQSQHQARIS